MKDCCYRMKVCLGESWCLCVCVPYIYFEHHEKKVIRGYQPAITTFFKQSSRTCPDVTTKNVKVPLCSMRKMTYASQTKCSNRYTTGVFEWDMLRREALQGYTGGTASDSRIRPDISRSLQVPYDIKVICVSNLHCLLWKPQGEDSQIFRLIWLNSLTKQEYLSFQLRMLLSDIVPSMFNDKKRGKVRRTQTDDLWIINPML